MWRVVKAAWIAVMGFITEGSVTRFGKRSARYLHPSVKKAFHWKDVVHLLRELQNCWGDSGPTSWFSINKRQKNIKVYTEVRHWLSFTSDPLGHFNVTRLSDSRAYNRMFNKGVPKNNPCLPPWPCVQTFLTSATFLSWQYLATCNVYIAKYLNGSVVV
jgi:hypothetical protein